MEFHEKLQTLRKGRGMTQEELAEAIFVSRTAVSKWESGRGYPSIDSLKALAAFFSITVDELLSTNEVLTIAQEDCERSRQAEAHLRDLIFGLLDVSLLLFLFLPLFAKRVGDAVSAVSILSRTGVALWIRVALISLIAGSVLWGVLTLALQNCRRPWWLNGKRPVSLVLHTASVLLCILGTHPYAAAFGFVFLAIKVGMLLKRS